MYRWISTLKSLGAKETILPFSVISVALLFIISNPLLVRYINQQAMDSSIPGVSLDPKPSSEAGQ